MPTETSPPAFAGDKKVGRPLLYGPERALVAWGTPRVPRWLETYHLTLLTLLWSGLNAVFGVLARSDLRWFWGVSAMIVLQYLTDLFDGAVGRARGTGLVKWGFYMDHFVDFIFLGSLVLAGYLVAPPGVAHWFIVLLTLNGAFMVSSFLSFAATNEFEIYVSGVGPTEVRILIIAINTVIISTGTSHFPITVPLICAACLIGLVVVVWSASRKLWAIDMANRAAHDAASRDGSDRSSAP